MALRDFPQFISSTSAMPRADRPPPRAGWFDGTAPVADGVWGEGPNDRDVRGIGRSPTNDSGHR